MWCRPGYLSYHDQGPQRCAALASCERDSWPKNAPHDSHHTVRFKPSSTGGGLDFWCGALGGLLADDTASGLTCSRLGSSLCLLCLLRALGGSALLLAVLDSLLAGSRAGLWTLRAALLDDIERSTNDGTLCLDLLATTGLGLLLRNTLAALSAAENSPRNATRVLALQEKRLALAVLETEDLAVRADEELALFFVLSAWLPYKVRTPLRQFFEEATCAGRAPNIRCISGHRH